MTDKLETLGSAWRTQSWRDAGSPVADMMRLSYAGADAVRWILERALRTLPPDVGWFCVEAIDWIEVGREAAAWAHHAPTPRAMPGDLGHRITLCGMYPDAVLPGLIAHEISHRWRKPVRPIELTPEPAPMAFVDVLGAVIYAKSRVQTEDEQWLERGCWISAQVSEELRADEQARAWGFDWRGHDRDKLIRRFTAQYDEARRMARLAAEYEHDDIGLAAASIVDDENNEGKQGCLPRLSPPTPRRTS